MFSSNMMRGRGILLYIKESLGATDYQVNEPFQHIWCKLFLTRGDNLLIGCIYRSPHSNAENNQNLHNLLKIYMCLETKSYTDFRRF